MSIYLLLVFFCSFLYGLSAVLCKIGLQHKRDTNLPAYSISTIVLFLIKNKIWLLGIVISMIANVTIIQIQSFIDVSVVYPILNFSYIFVLLLGVFFLNESLNTWQYYGVLTVVSGTLIILLIADTTTGTGTNSTRLLSISAISLCIIFGLVAFVHNRKIKQYEIFYAICTGISFGNVETYMKANTNLVNSEYGDFSVLSMNSLIQFINMWPFLILILFGIIGWVCMQITYSHGDVSVTVPMFAVIQSSITLGCGYFVFGEFFSSQKILGVAMIVSGVVILVVSALTRNPETETARDN
ncbi:MAG: EamA family transporter [Gammaproteobacteria bacterium]|nr:EamA family transporter [Gammaproteobacteria bacterium]